jgi:hypothetical protein
MFLGTSVLDSAGIQVALARIHVWPLSEFEHAAFSRGENFSAMGWVEKAHRTSLGEFLIKYFERV